MGTKTLRVISAVMLGTMLVSGSPPAGADEAELRPGVTIVEYLDGRAEIIPLEPSDEQALRRGSANALALGSFTVTYVGTVPAAVRQVVDQAASDWEQALVLNPQAPLEMQFEWVAFDPGILGQASATGFYKAPSDPYFYPVALANQLEGADVNDNSQTGANPPEMRMRLNSALGDLWHLDTTAGPPFEKIDLYSTVLHEIAHGLGFIGSATDAGSGPFISDQPDVYDALVRNGDLAMLDTAPASQAAALVSGNLSIEIGGGRTYQVNAPPTFIPGTSYAHFDSSLAESSPGFLMSPALANGQRSRGIDAPVLGVLEGLGWQTKAGPLGVAFGSPTATSSTVVVSWTEDLAGNATPAHVLRLEAVGPSSVEASIDVAGVQKTATLSGLQPDTDYVIRAMPFDRSGSAGPVTTVNVRTLPSSTSVPTTPGETPVEAVELATTVDEIIRAKDYNPAVDPEILRLYKAFFNREPDADGAKYWIALNRGEVDGFGATDTVTIAQAFTSSSTEFRNFYAAAPSDEEFLSRVYGNVLGRISDPAGFAYWLDILGGTNNSGANPAEQQADRGVVVFWVAKGNEFVTSNPYLP